MIERFAPAAWAVALALSSASANAQRSAISPDAPVTAPGIEPLLTQSTAPPRGDVALILLDDVNWFDVDNVATPAIDRLMEAGTTWRRFYSSPVCTPTRYALLYGRWPRRDGILEILESSNGSTRNKPHPDEGLQSLADLLKGQGYQTAFFGKWHTGLQFYGQNGTANPNLTPLFIGFDTWRAGSTSNVNDYFLWNRLDDGSETPTSSYADQDLANAVSEWWSESAGVRRRFATVGFRLAHTPIHTPPASLLPAGLPTPSTPREEFEAMLMAFDELLDRMIRFDAADPDGEIDLATTLVVLAADNGTAPLVAGQQPASRLKGTTYEGGVRCPLVIAGPGFEGGGVDDQGLVAPVDLFSTVVRWLRMPPIQGAAEDSVAIQSKSRRWLLTERVSSTDDDLAIVFDTWKLRRFNGIEQLFDLALDPAELTPLDPEDPAYVRIVDQIRAIEAALPPRP